MTDVGAQAILIPVDNETELDIILEAISELTPEQVMDSEAAADLDVLSTHTQIEAIEASPDGVFWTVQGRAFEAIATIYVVLNYGSSRDSDAMSDSYPAYVYGTFSDEKASVIRITVDTQSFYQ